MCTLHIHDDLRENALCIDLTGYDIILSPRADQAMWRTPDQQRWYKAKATLLTGLQTITTAKTTKYPGSFIMSSAVYTPEIVAEIREA